jgi:chaperonin cofactor prefoldin
MAKSINKKQNGRFEVIETIDFSAEEIEERLATLLSQKEGMEARLEEIDEEITNIMSAKNSGR